MMDKRVGGIDDGLGRAVVTLKFEQPRVRIALLESEDITYIRSAEGVDRLRVVAHYADVILRFGELFDDEVLGIVGVLILIDEDVLEDVLIVMERARILVEEQAEVGQQVVKIHRVSRLETKLVELIDIGHAVHAFDAVLLVDIGSEGIGLVVDEGILRGRDLREDDRGFVYLFVQLFLLADGLDQGLGIGRVVDREIARVAETLRLIAEDAGTDRMERAHPQVAGILGTDEGADTLFHFSGSLVGKSERQDIMRRNALVEQVRNLIREHAGLARPCTRDDELRSFGIGDRLALRLI